MFRKCCGALRKPCCWEIWIQVWWQIVQSPSEDIYSIHACFQIDYFIFNECITSIYFPLYVGTDSPTCSNITKTCDFETISLDGIQNSVSLVVIEYAQSFQYKHLPLYPTSNIESRKKKETWGLRLQQCQEPTISIHFIQKKCHRTPSALTSSKVSKAITSGRAVEEDEPARCPISFQEVHSQNYRSFDWTRRS